MQLRVEQLTLAHPDDLAETLRSFYKLYGEDAQIQVVPYVYTEASIVVTVFYAIIRYEL